MTSASVAVCVIWRRFGLSVFSLWSRCARNKNGKSGKSLRARKSITIEFVYLTFFRCLEWWAVWTECVADFSFLKFFADFEKKSFIPPSLRIIHLSINFYYNLIERIKRSINDDDEQAEKRYTQWNDTSVNGESDVFGRNAFSISHIAWHIHSTVAYVLFAILPSSSFISNKSSWTTHTQAKQATTAFHMRTILCAGDILARIDLVRFFIMCTMCVLRQPETEMWSILWRSQVLVHLSWNSKNKMENGKEAYRWRAFGTYASTAPLQTMHTKRSYTTHMLDFSPFLFSSISTHWRMKRMEEKWIHSKSASIQR